MSEAAAKLAAAQRCIRACQGEEALQKAKEAMELFERTGDKKGTADALRASIGATVAMGQASEAMDMAQAELKKFEASGNKMGQVAMYHAIAEGKLAQDKADAALTALTSAEALITGFQDTEGEAAILLTKADAHLTLGNGKAALSAASKTLKLASTSGHQLGQAHAWVAIMRARAALDKYDEALKAAEAALVTYLDLGDADGKAVTLYHLSKAHLQNAQYQKAMKAAGIALEHFRQQGSGILEADALDVVVQGLIKMEAKSEATRQARQVQARIEKTGNKKAAAMAMLTVIRAYRADDHYREGVVAAKDVLGVFQALQDKQHEGVVLCEIAQLYAEMGQLDMTRNFAEQALPIFKAVGDVKGEVFALELVGAAEDTKVRMQQEQDQKDDTAALLDKLKTALSSKNADAFKVALENAYNSGISLEEFQKALVPVFERDPEGTEEFWENNLPEGWAEVDNKDLWEQWKDSKFGTGRVFDRRYLYMMFRFGGMGYGPGFRLLKTGYRKGAFSYWSHGHTTLTLKDDHEEWEEKAAWHAGVLDCALQTGATRSFA